MESLYYGISLITAGISLAMGSVSLFLGLNKSSSKSYMMFGILGWLLTAFILCPPVGFITVDVAPYSGIVLVKRIFIFAYYAVLPWFIFHYSGRPGKTWPRLISAFTTVSYFVMFTTDSGLPLPLWAHFAIGIFGINLAYGIAGVVYMYTHGERRDALWLNVAIIFYGILFAGAFTNHVYYTIFGAHLLPVQRFFLVHLHSLALMFLVGFRLHATAIHKMFLERMVTAQRERWRTFLGNLPLLILEVNRDGTIITANDFAASQLRVASPSALIGMNWFDLFTSEQEKEKVRLAWSKRSHPATLAPAKDYFRIGQNEPVMVSWLSFAGSTEMDGNLSVVLVGQDLTNHESALVEVSRLRQEIEKEKLTQFFSVATNTSAEIIGTSKALGYTLQKAQQVAQTNATVLLEGETGVGKELFADYIQSHSTRKDKPFIKVNCSAMPSELIEDELFGHEKGAFTSASSARSGRFELADGGTILLDEIGELPLTVQPKLLRVLQQGEFERVGGQKTIRVDVRIIAATNRDLTRDVSEGRFRSDLLYRLNVFPISIPALRNRREDLNQLVSHFVLLKSGMYGKKFQQISKADLKRIHEYPWPGNIRELRNLIERSVIQSEGETLRLHWLEHNIEPDTPAPTSLEEIEREHIIKMLNECSWKINGANGAAERLEMNPNTLRSRMKKLNIVREHQA